MSIIVLDLESDDSSLLDDRSCDRTVRVNRSMPVMSLAKVIRRHRLRLRFNNRLYIEPDR
jgi:hypothetical protein